MLFRISRVLMLTVLTYLVLFSTFNTSAGTTVVVPNIYENMEEDNGNGFPLNCGDFDDTSQRYQQMYASSEFDGQECLITEIRFRRNLSVDDFGPTIIPNITVQLSTSPNTTTTMSSTFADNIGSDVLTVFSGDLSLSTNCGMSDPCPFDQVIPLDQGFPYNPSDGDLLIDFRIPTCVITSQQNDTDEPVMARAGTDQGFNPASLGVNATEADFVSLSNNEVSGKGLVTQFVGQCSPSGPIAIVPTMGQWGMIFASLILGIAAVLTHRRRTES